MGPVESRFATDRKPRIMHIDRPICDRRGVAGGSPLCRLLPLLSTGADRYTPLETAV